MLKSSKKKQACKCSHGKGIHRAQHVTIRNKVVICSPCNFPGCRCRNYKPKK